MSRLIVITHPELVPGFQLAGVDAYGPADVETTQEMITSWLEAGETGLLAIDNGLISLIATDVVKSLEESPYMLYIAIPGGPELSLEASRQYQIAEMIRRAIGFHITFKGEESD